MTERLLSADDVAAFLGVKRDTVYKLIDRSGLPALKVGRLWKFRQEQINEWVNRQSGEQQSPDRGRQEGKGA
ncbi:MAG: helix-turn-helix domain-containing protein [Phycisphaerales bacterium]|nr:helix-turn-helix domain-containing protein [Phycisphaerales bacterium]